MCIVAAEFVFDDVVEKRSLSALNRTLPIDSGAQTSVRNVRKNCAVEKYWLLANEREAVTPEPVRRERLDARSVECDVAAKFGVFCTAMTTRKKSPLS